MADNVKFSSEETHTKIKEKGEENVIMTRRKRSEGGKEEEREEKEM